ncbi:MAG: type 1 glutamine amidotransferase [Bdellovibrionaceae bacterium]|nr:type 1 glutamine amidotransferase [Pseudobdellovibrionaceae bacterium]MBX3033607.1 type 1 glutamine amidotransferase [Pseudobdellovibrionaceae bacterium]
MSDTQLTGRKVAILAADGYEQSELDKPKTALEEAGAEVHVVSLKNGSIKGWSKGNWSGSVHVDVTVEAANADDYDALMLPGGVINPDKLRVSEEAVDFVKSFVRSGKPIAAICHGPQTLIEAGGLQGRTMTSFPGIKTDLINAGAHWVDREVVTDQGLVTSRTPEDLDAFNEKMIEEFAEGRHAPRNLRPSEKMPARPETRPLT